MRSYGKARDVKPEDYLPPIPKGQVSQLQATVARLEHRSDCLEERIVELEAAIAKLIGGAQ